MRQTRASQAGRRRHRWRTLAALGGALLLIAVVVAVALRPGGGPVTVAAAPGAPYPEVARVSVAEARRLADSGAALLVDVRGDEYFAQARLTGAMSLPYDQVDQRLSELPRDKPLILYCT